MRRKSRVLLCFAVLWVLGIAYYFYSGTAMSRKDEWSSSYSSSRGKSHSADEKAHTIDALPPGGTTRLLIRPRLDELTDRLQTEKKN